MPKDCPNLRILRILYAHCRARPGGVRPRLPLLFAVLALVAVLAWSYRSPAVLLAGRWWHDPDYLHGSLVPIFSGVLLWLRRDMIAEITRAPLRGSWCGLAFLVVGAAMRWLSAYYYFALIHPLSLVPCLVGVVLLVGGWPALRWAGPSVAFLVFMMPLPSFIAGMASHPLQRAGTIASTYLLQMVGVPTVAKGNVIVLTSAKLGVVDACNGLRMMMLFATVCTGAALVMKRPWLDKVIIVLSAAPIALVANVLRITLTGILHETTTAEVADFVFHDLAAWLMMPTAVVLLWVEMGLLSKLLVPPAPDGPLSLSGPAGGHRPHTSPTVPGSRRKQEGPA